MGIGPVLQHRAVQKGTEQCGGTIQKGVLKGLMGCDFCVVET